jgi:hypothetical protein
MNYPATIIVNGELEHEYLLRARCISMFSEVLNLADENAFGELTSEINSVEEAESLLADFTMAQDALQRVTRGLDRVPEYHHLASSERSSDD